MRKTRNKIFCYRYKENEAFIYFVF